MEQRGVTANGVGSRTSSRDRPTGRSPCASTAFPTRPTPAIPVPELAAAGFHAVAPFLRAMPHRDPRRRPLPDRALARDANALHAALGGPTTPSSSATTGALTAYAAVAHEPDRWRRAVTAAVPPPRPSACRSSPMPSCSGLVHVLLPLPMAEIALPLDDYSFIDGLWADWSPGTRRASTWPASKSPSATPSTLPPPSATTGHVRPRAGRPELADEQNAALAPRQADAVPARRNDGCMLLSSIGNPSTSWPRVLR